MEILTTSGRIRLRKSALQDAPFILELVNTPAWLAYIGDRNIHSVEQAEAYIRNGPLKQYEKFGFGSFCMELVETGQPIGMCGLYKRDYFPHFDLGFALLPPYEGKGYMKEAAETILHLAENDWKLPVLLAITSQENTRSIGLLERLGFTRQEDVILPGETETLYSFRMELPRSNS